jgi:DNA-directed RNA polymerase specialized sigma24 family protein
MHSCLETETKKHYKTWLRFARGLVKNNVNGQDLLSEVLLNIVSKQKAKAEQLACEEKLFWYVNKAIYLTAKNLTSRYSIQYTRYAQHWNENSNRHNEEPEEVWLGSRLDNEYLDAYIQLMPQLDAIILRLYMLDDFDYHEVSEQTGIPVKDLYKLVENAINKIRRNATTYRSTSSTTNTNANLPDV